MSMVELPDVFGVKAHEEWHHNAERVLRRLVEQVSQLSIDLGQTRVELRRQAMALRALDAAKIDAAGLDPAWAQMDEAIKQARVWLAETEQSLDEQWDETSARLQEAVEQMSEQIAQAEGAG